MAGDINRWELSALLKSIPMLIISLIRDISKIAH